MTSKLISIDPEKWQPRGRLSFRLYYTCERHCERTVILSRGFAGLVDSEFKVSKFDIAVESVRIVVGLISARSIA